MITYIIQTLKDQFKGELPIDSKKFIINSGQHLALKYENVEPDSEWNMVCDPQKVHNVQLWYNIIYSTSLLMSVHCLITCSISTHREKSLRLVNCL